MSRTKLIQAFALSTGALVCSTGALCAPAQPTATPAERDDTDYTGVLAQHYDQVIVLIEDAQRSFVQSEAQYVDGTSNANDETKASPAFAEDAERHAKVAADVQAFNGRVDAMKVRYDELKASGVSREDYDAMNATLDQLNYDATRLRGEYGQLAVRATAAGTQR